MRSRNIKPGFFENDELGETSVEGRLLFIGLWCMADRDGRLEDRPRKIKGAIFRYDNDIPVDSLLSELEGKGFLIRYEANGARFIQIVNFLKHQSPHYTEKASIIPPPGKSFHEETDFQESNATTCVKIPLIPDSLIPDSLIPDSGLEASSEASCPEPSFEAPEPEQAAGCFLTIPTNKRGVEYPVSEADISEFEGCYPAVDVRQQIREMRAWAITHPERRKTPGGMPRFINAWLGREQDKPTGSKRDPPSTAWTKLGERNLKVAEAYIKKRLAMNKGEAP